MYNKNIKYANILTVLSFFHLCILPKMPDVTDNSPSDGGCATKQKCLHESHIHKEHINKSIFWHI